MKLPDVYGGDPEGGLHPDRNHVVRVAHAMHSMGMPSKNDLYVLWADTTINMLLCELEKAKVSS